jgi:Carboxypeptidase regulatory-like domain
VWLQSLSLNVRRISIVASFCLAFVAPISGQTLSKGLEGSHKISSVAGVVVDPRGDPIPGAKASLFESETGRSSTILSDDMGAFVLAADAGSFELKLSAPGFTAKTLRVEAKGDQQLNLGAIGLRIESASSEVIVSVSREELAQDQVRVEETQRILGVIPNFFVTYDHDAVPLSARQKYELALRTLADPETIGVDLISSGLQQKAGGLKGYGPGANGYMRRFAATYGTDSLDTLLGSAVLPSLFKQDPRYFYKGTGSPTRRALYAISMSVMCKSDSGHWQYNYSGLLGGLAAGGISNLYYPAGNRNGLNVTLENTAIGVGSSAVSNLLQEFVIRKLTRSKKGQP